MSGICGIVNFDGAPVDPDVLRKMAEASAYRGPHGIRYWIAGNVGFAHLALNTTPESLRERQPLLSADGLVCLTGDARVDNRPELISTLAAKGYLQEKDPTDADLILTAYRCWGEECPDRIIGDFAFAVWDAAQRKLFCARDAVGARPFCYNLDGHTLRFGSDVRQILADERVSRDLDGYAISDFLTFNFRYQARSMFAAVQKLLPGHCLAVDPKGPRGWRYWNPDQNPPIRYRTDAEYVEHFRELLFRCVADRLRSVKGAASIMTSGGVDSSSIAAIAQHLYACGQASTQPVAYAEVFDTLTECDEREYSLTLPAETGIEFHQIQAEQFYILDDELAYTPDLDTPMMLYESLTRHLHQRARDHGCDVLMTGFGGDSLFDAAKWQYVDFIRNGRWWKVWPWISDGRRRGRAWLGLIKSFILWPLLPRRVRYVIDGWRGTWRYWHVPVWIHPQLRKETCPAERLYQQGYSRHFRSLVRQIQYEHFIGLAQQGLAIELYNVRAAEYGMEARFPLLDRRLADFVLAVPIELGAHPGPENSKWLLRQAMAGLVPEKIRCRPNKGAWDKYVEHMLCNNARQKVRALFSDTQMARLHLVDGQILLDEFDSYCNNTDQYHSGIVFVFPMFLERWLRTHAPGQATIRFEQLESWQFE